MKCLFSLVLTLTLSTSLVIGQSINSSVSKDITERELNVIISKHLEVMLEGERSIIFFNPDLGLEADLESKEKCQSMTQSRLSVLI